jgi:signal transduction histidine kinase/ActR/RegA family two-component response regulator
MLRHLTRSLRGKLMLVVLATTLCALLFAAIALAVYEVATYDEALVRDLRTQAEILGRASEPALAFNDRDVALENLSALRLRPQVRAAALYARDGALFATHPSADADVPLRPEAPGTRVEGDRLVLFHPILSQGTQIGTLFLATRYALTARIVELVGILAAVMLASFAIAALLAAWLQRRITQPILDVTDVARDVIERRDFTLRATAKTDDEIGVLVRAFNDMLGEVGQRTEALEAAYSTVQHEIGVRRAAEAALRQADRRKDEFLATLAHELRNPLAPLRNGLDILRLPDVPTARLAMVRELMERQLKQLTRLVDDLLDVSRISTGKLAVRRERTTLQPIVETAVDTTRPVIDARGHRLIVDVPREPVVVDADPTRLAQLIGNLLNNAAKYTPPGGTITLSVAEDELGIEVAIVDTGIGIPAHMIERVFDMFTQVDTSLDRSTAGLGVGLSLARRLAELHGGTISAASEGAGRGSRFVVRLPRVEASAQPRPPGDAAGVGASTPAASSGATVTGARRRILLADDNVDFATSLAFILRGLGHEVVVTHDGVEALAAAREFRPEVAFLDIGLPRLHGYALARELRADAQTKRARLVAITGWGQERDRREAKDAGFDHHFVKPVSVEQILELLAEARARA